MRPAILLLLTLLLGACSLMQRDDSLVLHDLQLEVDPLWARATGELPASAAAQLPPLLRGDTLYVADVAGRVMALDAHNGEILWRVKLPARLSGGPGEGQGLLLVASEKARLFALERDSGERRWETTICSEMLATPAVTARQVLVQCVDGRLLALDPADGRRIWTYQRVPPALNLRGTASPMVVGDRVLAGFADGSLVALNLASGELQWESTIAIPRGRNDLERMVDVDGRFVVAEGVIYAVSYQGRVAALSLENGRFIWSREMSSHTGVALHGDQLYLADEQGQVWSLDRRTGATLWRQDAMSGQRLSPLAVTATVVSVVDDQGGIHWLDARDGHILARQSLARSWAYFHYPWEDEDGDRPRPDHAVSTYPLVAGDRLYIRDNSGALVAYRLRTQGGAGS